MGKLTDRCYCMTEILLLWLKTKINQPAVKDNVHSLTLFAYLGHMPLLKSMHLLTVRIIDLFCLNCNCMY